MIAIKPTFWRPFSVFWVVLLGGFFLSPVVFQAGAFPELAGAGSLAALAAMVWLGTRPARLEITEAEVRARHGWSPGRPARRMPSAARSARFTTVRARLRSGGLTASR
jgi:hypothetical protein